ncbi:hypothetical protein QQF64_000838 [Cirrhinus molitorella]|uniref:Uncharacterized protein n=1 Tax=Cirrhinus molitorella TaxID=172907 RepID=A0ABR3NYU3_9TELE
MEDEEGEEDGRKKKMGEEVKSRERIKKGAGKKKPCFHLISTAAFSLVVFCLLRCCPYLTDLHSSLLLSPSQDDSYGWCAPPLLLGPPPSPSFIFSSSSSSLSLSPVPSLSRPP